MSDAEDQEQEEQVHSLDNVLENAIAAGFETLGALRGFLFIAGEEYPFVHDYQEAMGLSYGGAVIAVGKLKKRGLVESGVEPRSRRKCLALSDLGREAFDWIAEGGARPEGL